MTELRQEGTKIMWLKGNVDGICAANVLKLAFMQTSTKSISIVCWNQGRA